MARALVIAGTHSGVGKTSFTLGLARAFTGRGLRVRAAKVGPDYLDPMHLALATGRSCPNLDTFMMGPEYVLWLANDRARDVDLLLVEGVMGLYDGAHPESSQGSTAEIARLLDVPVLLVTDASGQARSLAATVYGFSRFEAGPEIAGVIANRVGSPGHGDLLTQALASASLPPLVAAVVDGGLPHLPSRHLGLCQPGSGAYLDQLAHAVAESVALDRVFELARPPRTGDFALAAPLLEQSLRLAVAEDAAFGFVYADFREALHALGVEWVACSPLRDRQIPQGVQALYLPGGYPEEHAAELAENQPFLRSLREFARHRPIYAECGGSMYLGTSLIDRSSRQHGMAGLVPASFRMLDRVHRLGYAEVTLTCDSLWGLRGDRCRGHEFHYSALDAEPPSDLGWQRAYSVAYREGPARLEGYQRGSLLASYVHLHLPSRPRCLRYFLQRLAA
jgi:cobyrinic acid a,c-diamide synthase